MFQLWVNYVLKRQMPPCPRLYVSSMDTLQYAGFLPLKLVFSTVLFGDELISHRTSTLHCLENGAIARLISVLASGLLGYCACSQPLTRTSERFILVARGNMIFCMVYFEKLRRDWHPLQKHAWKNSYRSMNIGAWGVRVTECEIC